MTQQDLGSTPGSHPKRNPINGGKMFQDGVVKSGEICPGVSWENHADSLARFTDNKLFKGFGISDLDSFREIFLDEIDGDPNEVKQMFAKLERNS